MRSFNTIDHKWLLKFVEHRIADRRMLQLIRKWLSAGVLEEGRLTESRQGSPQGASVSPLVSNIYLHYVLDLWVQQWRRRCGHGDIIVVRYADDFTVGFQYGADADRFVQDLRERMRRFSLELHAEKTRTIEFGRFAASNRAERGQGKPETFDFLGFTHICAKTKAGRFLLQRRTIAKRTRVKLHEVSEHLRRRRHTPIPEQGSWLRSVVPGYFAYHAVPTNSDRLGAFRYEVARAWYRALRRRGQHNPITWTRTCALADRWLPPVCVLHPWPEKRFDANTRRKSPVR